MGVSDNHHVSCSPKIETTHGMSKEQSSNVSLHKKRPPPAAITACWGRLRLNYYEVVRLFSRLVLLECKTNNIKSLRIESSVELAAADVSKLMSLRNDSLGSVERVVGIGIITMQSSDGG